MFVSFPFELTLERYFIPVEYLQLVYKYILPLHLILLVVLES